MDTLASVSLIYYSFNFHRTSFFEIFSVFPLRPLSIFATSKSPVKRLTYWHRPHTSKTKLPVLFIHGIGVGLYPYINFLADINAEDCRGESVEQVGIIAIELMSVSSRITAEALSKEEMCDEVCRIIAAHGWNKFVLVSHSYVFAARGRRISIPCFVLTLRSYGSVIATHLLRSPWIEQKIGPLLFIDPVCFLLHLPDVAHNFVWSTS